MTLRFSPAPAIMNYAASFYQGNRMRSRTIFAACSTAVLALSALAWPALASESTFDSLDGATSSAAYASGIDPVMSATFSTGATPVRVGVALLLFDGVLGDGEPSAT